MRSLRWTPFLFAVAACGDNHPQNQPPIVADREVTTPEDTALEFAVRLTDERRVAVVRPGAATPLADLPQEPIEGTGVAQVVRGELPYLLTAQDEGQGAVSVLVVPLRTGGRVLGAMAMTARGSESFSRTDMALAQQLADLAAPHLELARRSGGLGGPIMPGWRRTEVREQVEEE